MLARNEAQKGLAEANRDVKNAIAEMETTAGRGSQALARTQQSAVAGFSEAGRSVRLLVTPLVSELNPALGELTGGFTRAAGAARLFGATGGAIVVAATVGAAALTQYVRSAISAAEKQADLNFAVRGFDASGLRSELTTASRDLERAQAKMEAFRRAMIPGTDAPERSFFKGLLDLIPGFSAQSERSRNSVLDFLFGVSAAERDRAKAREALAKVLPVERELALAEAYQKQQGALQQVLGVELQYAQTLAGMTGDLATFLDLHLRIRDAIAAEAAAAREAAIERATIEKAQAIQRAGSEEEARPELDLIEERLRRELELLTAQAVARQKARENAEALATIDLRTRGLQRDLLSTDIGNPTGATSAEIAAATRSSERLRVRIIQDEINARHELNQVELERLQILGQMGGLTTSQREQLDVLIIQERTRYEIAQAQLRLEEARRIAVETREPLDPRLERALQNRVRDAGLRGAIDLANQQRGALERTDFFAGIARGFRDVNEDLESFGREGQRIIRDFAQNTEQYFSDLLFVPIEKGWKRALEEVPKQLALSTLRSVTDLFGRFATQSLFGAVTRGFPGLAALLPVAGGPLVGQATAGPLVGPGIDTVRALQGVTPLGTAASPGAGLNLASLPIGSVLPSGGGYLGTLLNTPISALLASDTVLTSGGLVSAGGELITAGTSAGAASIGAAPTAGLGALTISNAFGIVGGALGLGFTIYGALQGPPTAQNILLSGVSGAVSGATLGAGIGSIFPGVGTAVGAVVGAIAGAALGAGAGAMGKDTSALSQQRKQERANTGNRVLDELTNAIQDGSSLDAIAFAPIHTGNTVGGLLLRIAAANAAGQFAGAPWQWPAAGASTEAIALLAPLGVTGEEFNEGRVNSFFELVASWGSDPAEGGRKAQRLLEGFVDKANQIQEQESNIPIAFDEAFAGVPGVGGISRRTFLPLTRLQEALASGQPLLFSRGMVQGLDDNAIELLWERLRRVVGDRSLADISRRRFSGEV